MMQATGKMQATEKMQAVSLVVVSTSLNERLEFTPPNNARASTIKSCMVETV